MLGNFKIYDASAGTGKTFNLASNYIVTAMISGFENILAVTFTNAAAKEMKDRIIEVLYAFSVGSQENEIEGYRKKIKELYLEKTAAVLNDAKLQEIATKVLSRILHRYSFFNVLTIDAFFQMLLKNLTKELSVTGNYILSLNSKKYDEAAVEMLLDNTLYSDDEREKVFDWLKQFFIKNSQDGKTWNIEKMLKGFAVKAFADFDVADMVNEEKLQSLTIENLSEARTKLKEKINAFEDELQVLRDAFMKKCKDLGLTAKDFKEGNKNGVYNYIEKMPKEIADLKDWEERKCVDELLSECNAVASFVEKEYSTYCLDKIYYDCIYPLGVLSYIAKNKSELLKKDNMFLLNDTAYLLNKLNEGDVPFVFEKISQRIDNIFIDEFQDTNRSSFYNLNKLMEEALQNQGSVSIFGDIKQSIYRFNGGDCSIMQGLIQYNPNSKEPLKENFRSLEKIVRFNNEFFAPLYEEFEIKFDEQSSFRGKNKGGGVLRFQFSQKDEVYDYIKREIDYYTDKLSYDLNDIAVLFRGNDKLIDVANSLKNERNKDYNPVSDIAFKFSSSLAVCKIVETLKYIDNKEKRISCEIISNENKDLLKEINLLAQNYKNEKSLLEVIMKIAAIEQIDDDAVFLPAFYDTVKDYVKTHSGDLTEFLDYWEENLQDKNVDMSGAKAGVHLTSIHKSKGLAYKVVIVPYCNYTYYKSEEIWVKAKDNDYSLPIFSARSSKLENTDYNIVYEQEKKAQKLDVINLLYVAFTRSKDNLSVILEEPSKKFKETIEKNKAEEVKSVNEELYKYLINDKKCADKQERLQFVQSKEDCNLFVCGSVENKEAKKELKEEQKNQDLQSDKQNIEEIEVEKIQLYDNNIIFATEEQEKAQRFFTRSYHQMTQMEKGTMYHSMVSLLLREEDKANILENKVSSKADKQQLSCVFDYMIGISKEKSLHWFDTTYKILNEKDIYCKVGTKNIVQKRPDRIMYSDDEVVVVDYKFGEREKKHIEQVQGYTELLKKMSVFKNFKFKGYLWYIDVENIEQSSIERCF